MAKFQESEKGTPIPILFDDIYAEVPGGGPLAVSDGAYASGTAVGYNSTKKVYEKVVKDGESPNFTYTPTPVGLLWNPNPNGGEIERIVLGAVIRKEELPEETDVDILNQLPNIIWNKK